MVTGVMTSCHMVGGSEHSTGT